MTGIHGNRKLGTLEPGAVIGIIGGGQLGRMTAIAANHLGFKTAVLSERPEDPATHVANHHIPSTFDDPAGLTKLAELADVVTYELEQLPITALQFLAPIVPIVPGIQALQVAQDRINEKTFLAVNNIPTAPWHAVRGRNELLSVLEIIGYPAILKVAYGGYDGKGQAIIDGNENDYEILSAWDDLSKGVSMTGVLERRLSFDSELSVIIARDSDGNTATYDPTHNIHKNHVLDTSTVPAPISAETSKGARSICFKLAKTLDLVGLLCTELFLMPTGELFVNEIAPRPHNSGHWTLDASHTSQFEQLVRAITGLKLGDPSRFTSAHMKNLIGADIHKIEQYEGVADVKVHLYGKTDPRPGRKMGHVTFLNKTSLTE
ncbi:MAG: 5-(carboxyamino)imidazole ribonucleotide synthase [Rhodospirillaceae bacterium TMED8]|nr:5-(carboxyamino)imidazole ribonucleotide synthase [Magnetovibrio sp.]OUT53195.1 MAG: 5-(carboxyamino)imidazole ribonucleotide synthase [Rhodospirillaceae bacterium TMED8]|tara:strand:+ start:1304 stop:2431 length:1128 start_codon:yes stop_codon:yes gene_type:complete